MFWDVNSSTPFVYTVEMYILLFLC